MKNSIILITLAALTVLVGCKQKHVDTFDWDSQDRREYAIDYTVSFAADNDSTMQLTATSNYGSLKVAQIASEDLLDADDKPVKNTFAILEDSVPMGKNITLHPEGLSYCGGKPEILHVQTVGSDDMVEMRIQGTDTYTLYSIRDNMFFGPDEQQSFTIPGGQRFSVVLPIMTEERYPKTAETHTVKIGFAIAASI
ncbi:MAG: hypothetical protein IJ785_06585 [Bacteroidales bacterium]|nr:hypothetical protein [Bacteroidales bacterium]